MVKKILFLMGAALISAAAAAMPLELRPDHPQTYVVKRGDTLWDISGRFLTSPWRWPDLWRANPQVRNPHLIYPGDVLTLVYRNGQPTLEISSGLAHLGGRDHLEDFTGMTLTIKGKEFTIDFAENSDRGTFTIDPAKSPKWITIATNKKGPFFGRTLQGIYKIEKSQLVICCEVDGKTRPTAFEAPEKSRNMLLTFRREKK